jgi:hypothetical protein
MKQALFIFLAISMVGLVACVPTKAPSYPAIQNTTAVPASETVTSQYLNPLVENVPDSQFSPRQTLIQQPQLPLPPSPPNPYLKIPTYTGMLTANYTWPSDTPWGGGGFYYYPATVPPVSVGTVFWTGTATVTVN